MNSFFLVASYLAGAVPFGLLISKAAGVDVRREGSRNIGATNVTRVLGKKLGLLTLLCDVAKGYLPMRLAYLYLPEGETRQQIISLCGVMAVVGHMFPVFLMFKGGKGVATGLGVFLFFSPAAIAVSLVIFITAVAGTGYVSVGSLAASALVPLWVWFFGSSGSTILAAACIAFLIWIKHWENIRRLFRGEEKTWVKRNNSD
jgi:acyl phosphate:glycerol-3-phosphate acyltransferase